ncbi:hypothetical protein [Streptomyces sp. NPDC020681]|uniref:hypothetical protein n=1 Tax=Streptomyces sp. NPDC020681 TaxID=3365083 RepID=UPI0037A496D0
MMDLERAHEVLRLVLTRLGTGTHVLTLGRSCGCVASFATEPVAAEADAVVVEETVFVRGFYLLLADALTADGGTSGLTARTVSEDAECVRGWVISDGRVQALTEAEVFAAYCTDPVTGEPVSPEWRVRYEAGFPVEA